MYSFLRFLCVSALCAALLPGCDSSNDPLFSTNLTLAEAEVAAIEAMKMHMEARNNRYADGLAAANNYPQVRLGGDAIQIYDNYEIYSIVEELITIPYLESTKWDHSVWDVLDVVQSSPNKVHIAAQFSRIDAAGSRYLTSLTFWIVTKQDGHWGIKFRSSYVDEANGDSVSDPAEVEAAAVGVLEMHMEARNNRDTAGLAAENNYPLVRLDGGDFQIFDTPEEYVIFEESNVIPDLDYAEWDRSEWDVIEVVQSGVNKVHISAQFSRFDTARRKYLTEAALWIVTNKDGHWGIQGRSNFVGVND